jgi:NAD(P)-dependent dehydrogenase (short-subunit alcohol dehydrogenase family)
LARYLNKRRGEAGKRGSGEGEAGEQRSGEVEKRRRGEREKRQKMQIVFYMWDILVNNAATQASRLDDFLDLTHDRYITIYFYLFTPTSTLLSTPLPCRILHTFSVNIIPMFDFARYCIPYMKAGGSIINTASVQAYEPSWQVLDYAATKGKRKRERRKGGEEEQ